MKKIAWIVVFSLFACGSARADTVVLKSGKEIQGRIIEKAADYIKIRYNDSDVYFETKYISAIKKDEEAPAVAEKTQNAVTDSALERGLDLAVEGKFDEAEGEFNKELADVNSELAILAGVKKGTLTSECAVYLFEGSRYILKGNYQQAAASLEKAWAINPKDPDINYNLGAIYFALMDFQKAIAYLFASLKLEPQDPEAYLLLAQAYYNTAKYQDARESLLTAKKIFQKNSDRDGIIKAERLLQEINAKP